MLLKKPHYSICILLLTILLVLQSCEKKKQNIPKKQHNVAEIDRLIDLGDKYFKESKYDSSYYYFNKARSICDEKRDVSKIIYSLSNLATIQQNQGDYSGSETTAIEAILFLENNVNPIGKWNIYTILGINYLRVLDYKTALYYYNKALNLKTNERLKLLIKNNIAAVYMEMEDYHHAIQILFPLTLKKEIMDEPVEFSRILANLGYSYYKVGDPKALDYLNQSIKIRERIKDNWGMISSYYNLSEYYKKSNLNLSVNYALLAYQKATKLNNPDDRLLCLELLIQNSTGNQSKKYSLLYLKINDSINKVRQKAKNQFAKIKYDSKKEKEENLTLKAQKAIQSEQQENKSLLFFFIVTIGIITTLFISYFLIAKNKREKIETSYSTEIRISKKLHDELANDVYQTMAFAETQDLSSANNKETLLGNLDTIYSRTRNISKENSTIETGIDFLANLKEMISGYNTDSINILINGFDTINWSSLENIKKITIYRVLQELLVNMKKHSKCSLIVLSFKKNKNDLQIDYSDNGIGATFDKIKLKNGLQNVENRIGAIKGTVAFDTKSNNGFKVSLTFPI